jgi:hypothetical protein
MANQKRLFFEEYDRLTQASGHTHFEHLRIATESANGGDIRSALSDFEQRWVKKSQSTVVFHL